MNSVCKQLGKDFDENGRIAKRGSIIPQLFKQLNNLPFYKKQPPKSLSREWVNKFINPLLKNEYIKEDILHTICEHVSVKISELIDSEETFFTGGGTFNTYLMSRISKHAKSNIIMPDKSIINFKEALIFGFLGVLKIRDEVNCLRSVTGAIKDSCGGEINNPM